MQASGAADQARKVTTQIARKASITSTRCWLLRVDFLCPNQYRKKKTIDLVYVLTRGGPGNASEVLANLMYFKAFQGFRQSYACAIAVVLFVMVLPAALTYVKTILKSESEE